MSQRGAFTAGGGKVAWLTRPVSQAREHAGRRGSEEPRLRHAGVAHIPHVPSEVRQNGLRPEYVETHVEDRHQQPYQRAEEGEEVDLLLAWVAQGQDQRVHRSDLMPVRHEDRVEQLLQDEDELEGEPVQEHLVQADGRGQPAAAEPQQAPDREAANRHDPKDRSLEVPREPDDLDLVLVPTVQVHERIHRGRDVEDLDGLVQYPPHVLQAGEGPYEQDRAEEPRVRQRDVANVFSQLFVHGLP
mmetsp:Transcript_48181/g.124329  ORF Transcript_48181/g.124329 Transcript_48181/m.124329 type:complete len:244 (-) Transcript_48181:598-1329(-)